MMDDQRPFRGQPNGVSSFFPTKDKMLKAALLGFLGLVNADAAVTGNCLTQRIDFTDPSRFPQLTRVFALDGIQSNRDITELDTSRYDFTIDYFSNQVRLMQGGGVNLTISDNPRTENPDAPRLSTTRFMLYGKVTARLRAVPIPGVVTTFVTLGPNLPDAGLDLSRSDPRSGDEIDWELLGNAPNEAQTNIFYRGIKEFAVRGNSHPVSNGIAQPHTYTIDWKRDRIEFYLDDQLVRTYAKNDPAANSAQFPNRRFYPDRPGKVQFAVWSERQNSWAGGAPRWPAGSKSASAIYEWVEIQCYDDNDKPVPKWPLNNNPDAKPSAKDQPTHIVGGVIPARAGPGGESLSSDSSVIVLPDGTVVVPAGPSIPPIEGLPDPFNRREASSASQTFHWVILSCLLLYL